jgi:signal transduction histidine kinase
MSVPVRYAGWQGRFRPSARLRLTAIYTLLFGIAGVALLAVNYSLVSSRLPNAVAADGSPDSVIELPNSLPVPAGEHRALRVALAEGIMELRQETLAELVRQSATALVVALILAVALGWAMAGRVLRPVHQITSTARRLTSGDLRERIPVAGPKDELRELAETFNDLLDRIQDAFEQERRLVANMSHEVRTPLANQRVALEIAISDPAPTAESLTSSLGVALEQNIRTSRIAERILQLAQAESAAANTAEVVNLGELTRREVARLPSSQVEVTTSIVDANVDADPVLLERAVGNLLENAVKYNRPGGWISAEVTIEGQTVVLRVANSGRSMSPSELSDIAEPFHRGAGARTSSADGTGLGLAIVSAVARRYRGRLRFLPVDGGGLQAVLSLPRTQAPADLEDSVGGGASGAGIRTPTLPPSPPAADR